MRKATFQEAQERVREAVSLGFHELDRVIRVAEAAAHVGYSPFHFQRLFHAMTGEPWAEFHRRLRLERAAAMCWVGELKTFAIALRCGFENPEVFTRAFRAAFGCNPSEFQKLGIENPILPSPNGVHEADPDSMAAFRALREPGKPIPFEVRGVDEMRLLGIPYQGPLQFISKAWLELHEWANQRGIDLNQRLLVTYAEDLDEETPPEQQSAYVAMDDQGEEGLLRFAVPSGLYLTARHRGSGHLLADFWLRMYAECLPESGYMLREAPAFQIYPEGLFVENPDDFVTDIYIPLEANGALKINRFRSR
jgi:AraC family transcriptional regulator